MVNRNVFVLLACLLIGTVVSTAFSQETVCIDGTCYRVESVQTVRPLPAMLDTVQTVATVPARVVSRVVAAQPVRSVVRSRPVRNWVRSGNGPIRRLLRCGG